MPERSGSLRCSARNCQPFITGIVRSSKMSAGRRKSPRRRSRASPPWAAPATSYPSSRRISLKASRRSLSSSTIRMRLPPVTARACCGLMSGFRRPPFGRGFREPHGKCRALSGRALDSNAASQAFHDLAHDPETEAEAAIMAVGHGPLESLENPSLVLRWNPDAMIPDRKDGRRPVPRDPHLDGPAGTVLGGVGEEIRDDLFETDSVPLPHARAIRLDLETAPGAREILPETRRSVPDDRREVHRLQVQIQPAGRDARDVEKAVDQRGQSLHLALGGHDSRAQSLHRRFSPGVPDLAREALDLELQRRQRRLQLVGGNREELVARANRFAGLAIEPRIFDRGARAAG